MYSIYFYIYTDGTILYTFIHHISTCWSVVTANLGYLNVFVRLKIIGACHDTISIMSGLNITTIHHIKRYINGKCSDLTLIINSRNIFKFKKCILWMTENWNIILKWWGEIILSLSSHCTILHLGDFSDCLLHKSQFQSSKRKSLLKMKAKLFLVREKHVFTGVL